MFASARHLGFTLIELMIAVVIGAILVSGGLAAYRGIGEKDNLKQAGASLQTNLKLFQQKALAGEKPSGCSDSLEGFSISKVADNKYQVIAECSVINGDPVEYKLGENVSFSMGSLSENITFQILRREIIGAQTVTLVSSSYSYEVVVESSGVIRGSML